MKFPETVPLLTGNDIIKGVFEDEWERRRCLTGWCNYTFNGKANNISFNGITARVRKAIKRVIQKWYYPNKSLNKISIVLFNDSTEYTNQQKAEVWNEAMRRLGYTETV